MAARLTKPEGKKPDKLWHHAIMRAVNRPATDVLDEKAPKLEFLADQLVMKGMAGDVPALREIGDRLDGKPSQTLEHTDPGGGNPFAPLMDMIAANGRPRPGS